MSPAPLIPEQRQQKITSALQQSGALSIRDLSQQLQVSHMTIRRDIAALEESGQVVSIKGGVKLAEGISTPVPLDRASRLALELPRKNAIAQAAAEKVHDGMTIFIDAGTTLQALVPFLELRQGLTVMTNDLFVATTLFNYPHIHTVQTGGTVDPEIGACQGHLAARSVEVFNFDLAFISSSGWSLNRGITAPAEEKRVVKRKVMEVSTTSILLADTTKYGVISMVSICPLSEIDGIITDWGLEEQTIKRIRDLGVDLTIAQQL
ncbi:MAG TPA: DeoR/GlpR family DNA-binding transcription regulator [Corynebacterium glutamicum]|nr:DeoR/GlpR family DNA-binding transcription regulator [Corynebacterium glutamicum]